MAIINWIFRLFSGYSRIYERIVEKCGDASLIGEFARPSAAGDQHVHERIVSDVRDSQLHASVDSSAGGEHRAAGSA
jgi:hypothetical protein